MRVNSYKNPDGQCASLNGDCCDELNVLMCTSLLPDPYFTFCLIPLGYSESDCPLGNKQSDLIRNSVSLSFVSGSSTLLGLPNPLPFDVSGSWLVRR